MKQFTFTHTTPDGVKHLETQRLDRNTIAGASILLSRFYSNVEVILKKD